MVYNMDGYYRCDTCGCTGRIPRPFLVKEEQQVYPPVVGRINDSLIFVQLHNTTLFLEHEQACEVVDRIIELVTEKEAYDDKEEFSNDNT